MNCNTSRPLLQYDPICRYVKDIRSFKPHRARILTLLCLQSSPPVSRWPLITHDYYISNQIFCYTTINSSYSIFGRFSRNKIALAGQSTASVPLPSPKPCPPCSCISRQFGTLLDIKTLESNSD